MREEPWVPNVRCQVCIFRPLWDGDDYRGNYSAFEQSVFCAEHWEAHLPVDLMLVFLSTTRNVSVLVRDTVKEETGKQCEVKCNVCSLTETNLDEGERVAVPCAHFPLPFS